MGRESEFLSDSQADNEYPKESWFSQFASLWGCLKYGKQCESRLPLLDERVAENLRQEDINHITSPIVNKILLRSILPNEINIPNTKLGFVSNFEFIFSDSSYYDLLENTYPNYLLNVMKLLNGSTTTNQKWKLLQIVLWHEEFERFINTEIDTAV